MKAFNKKIVNTENICINSLSIKQCRNGLHDVYLFSYLFIYFIFIYYLIMYSFIIYLFIFIYINWILIQKYFYKRWGGFLTPK